MTRTHSTRRRRRRHPGALAGAALLALAAAAAGACDRRPAAGTGGGDGGGGAAAAEAEHVDSAAAALAAREAQPAEAWPRRIYYDLTRFEWYRRGEALVAEGAPHDQAGDPVPIPGDSMRHGGTYQDVDWYVRVDDAAPGVVFVPVFERYWLPFVRAGAGPPAADTAGR